MASSGDAVRIDGRLLRRLRLILTASVAFAAIVVLAVPAATGSAQFVWNVTESAPAGLYRIAREPWIRGDRVAVEPGEALAAELQRRGVLSKGKLLIKRVAAMKGDAVCRRAGVVSINGRVVAHARSSDSMGRPLPTWEGCAILTASQIFLLGDTASSYDGRYFGVTPGSEIVGRAIRMLAF